MSFIVIFVYLLLGVGFVVKHWWLSLIPLSVIALGAWVMGASSGEGSADVRGPGESIGLMVIIVGLAIAALFYAVWLFFF